MIFLTLSVLGLVVFVAPVLSILGFLRGRAMRAQLDELSREVEALRAQVGALNKRVAAAAEPPAAAPAAAPPPSPSPKPAATPSAAPPAPAVRPVPSTTPPPPIQPPAPVVPRPAPLQAPPPAVAGPQPTPPPRPPQPPRVPPAPAPVSTPPPPVPPTPSFDWESMLGVRGAAWLGGVTLVIAALFFAKWSIDQGFFTPVIRVSTMLLLGSAALVWAELKLREQYQTTANAVSGAGVVTLYAAFFSGYSLYQLFALPVAFGGMALVTLLAGVIAVRFDALFTALIGLAGGLATPVLLSTGVDRPVGFFSYLSLLAAGFLYVAGRRTWPAVTGLALVGTSLLQLGWYDSYMAPEKMVVGTVAFTVIGGIYLWHAVQTRDLDSALMHQAALTGALVPLGFAILLAVEGRFAANWITLIAFVLVVDAALVATALRSTLPILVGGSAVGTALVTLLLGNVDSGAESVPFGLSLALIALTAAYGLLPRLAARSGAEWLEDSARLALGVAGVTTAGLLGFCWIAADGGQLPLWAFVAGIATSVAIAVDRTREGRWPGAFATAVLAIAWTCRHWVLTMAQPETYADQLTLPHLLATAVAIVSAWRTSDHKREPAVQPWQTDHAATLAATFVAYATVLTGLVAGAGSRPVPLFALVGLDVGLLLFVAIQAAWTSLVPVAAAMSLLFNAAWHGAYFESSHATAAFAVYTVAYVVFLVFPFAMARWRPGVWKTRPAPWLVSALIGPATFPFYYALWRDLWGTAVIGVVPVVMAAVSVAALYGVTLHFQTSADQNEARRRLNYLALFAAITLGFIATAVPLQLERQWITIAWALEAAAVWWLFGMLPHPGLKYFGLALFLAVGVRLLLNPEVLQYQPRGGPIVNWLLYTYGVPALCCFAGTYVLRRAEARRGPEPEYDVLQRDRDAPGALVGFIGLLLVFWVINLEIEDYYSVGRYVEVDLTRHLARDLTRSFAWGLFALTLLGLGLWRVHRSLRLVSLGFLLLTVAKVFLYDLGQLTGLYRIVSFLGLGVSLILVSLLYQRFVRRSEVAA